MKPIKAVGLFSGGMDSALAIKLVQEQGIEVIALNFVSPFCTCIGEGCSIVNLAKQLGVNIHIIKKGEDYVEILKKPKHGYGKNINPCIDCKIYILKKAKIYADEIGAKFLFTGDVVGQRPMSQHFQTLMLIDKEAGLSDKLVRPLSAGLLPETDAEKNGWVDRSKFLEFRGRQRIPQLDLAKKYELDGFMCGGGGCRLTQEGYAKKIKDLFDNIDDVTLDEIKLLNGGRYFRIDKTIIIVGRDEKDNVLLTKLKKETDTLFDIPVTPGAMALVRGKLSSNIIEKVAGMVARYSDIKPNESVEVVYGKKKVVVQALTDEEIDKLRDTNS